MSDYAQAVFDAKPEEVGPLLRGELSLGSFCWFTYLGYTEELWPLVVVAQLWPTPTHYGDSLWRLDLSEFRERMVIDFESRRIRVEICDKDQSATPRIVSESHQILRFRALVFNGYETEAIDVRVNEADSFAVHISTHPHLLKLIANRLNFLWLNGRTARSIELPEYGERGGVKWRNLQPGLARAPRRIVGS